MFERMLRGIALLTMVSLSLMAPTRVTAPTSMPAFDGQEWVLPARVVAFKAKSVAYLGENIDIVEAEYGGGQRLWFAIGAITPFDYESFVDAPSPQRGTLGYVPVSVGAGRSLIQLPQDIELYVPRDHASTSGVKWNCSNLYSSYCRLARLSEDDGVTYIENNGDTYQGQSNAFIHNGSFPSDYTRAILVWRARERR